PGAASKGVVRPMQNVTPRVTSVMWLLAVVMAVGMASGCARSPGASSGAAGTDGTVRSHRLAAESATLPDESEDEADYDPWQSFKGGMSSFTHDVLDGYMIKPAAEGGAKICPDAARRSFARLINNFDMPRRLVNNLLQARPIGAAREVARF